MIGLRNHGNTCYMNSALQLFFNITHINSFFTYQHFKHPKLVLIQKSCKDYNNMANVDPTIFQILLPKFANKIQHDSQEFLCSLFELIDELCEKEKVLSPCFYVESQILNILKSNSYTNMSRRNEKFLILDHDISLNDAYSKYISVDKIDNFYNEKEKQYTVAKKQMLVGKWSPWLIIHINQYTNQLAIINDSMNIPFMWTIQHMIEKIKIVYHVVSAIIHSGSSLDYGHYTSIIRKEKKYYHVNDDIINEINKETFKQLLSHAYLVCYKMKQVLPL